MQEILAHQVVTINNETFSAFSLQFVIFNIFKFNKINGTDLYIIYLPNPAKGFPRLNAPRPSPPPN